MPLETTEDIPKLNNNLQRYQNELQQLGQLAGLRTDYEVFRILVEMINMGLDVDTIYNLVNTIKRLGNPRS